MLRQLKDWFFGLIDKRIQRMRQEIVALTEAVDSLTQQTTVLTARVQAEVANSNALKAALNAAIEGQLSAEDVQALELATSAVGSVEQALGQAAQDLADSTAVNNPAN